MEEGFVDNIIYTVAAGLIQMSLALGFCGLIGAIVYVVWRDITAE
jgi:hypothetical protein